MSRQTPGAFPLYDLLARVWRLPAPAVAVRYDRASRAVCAALADGALALIDVADAEPPDSRIQVDEAGRRAIAPRREPPRPAVTLPARGDGPARIAAGPEGFVAARADGTLSRIGRDGAEKLTKASGPLRALDVGGDWGLALVGENGVEMRARDGSGLSGGADWDARAVAISPHGGRVAFGCGRTLRVAERADPFGAAREYACPAPVERIVWRGDETYLLALCGAGGVALLDLASNRFATLSDFPTPPRSADFSEAGAALVAAGAYRIAAWDLNRPPFDGERGGALETGRPGLVPVVEVTALARRHLVAAAYANGQIVIAALGQRDELILQALGPEPGALVAAPDGRTLAVASGDSLALVSLPDALFK